MEKQTLEKKIIVHNNISYLQYDLATDQANTSFFDISDISVLNKMHPEALQEMYCHNFYSIFWFNSGKGTHIVDFDEYEIEQGTVFFLSPKPIHTYRNLSNVDGIAMCFPEDFLLKIDNELQGRIKTKMFYPANGFAHCKISEAAKEKMMPIVKLMQEASALQYEDKSLQASYFASLLSLLLIDMIRLGEWGDSSFSNVSSDSFQVYAKFVQMVEDNYIEHHAVKDYIEKLGVSQTTLNLYTQQYAKTTPLKIINNRIILEAKRLLRYSTTRTKQIAFYLEFKDDSYFIKLFKRNVGMSPVEFRQKEK